LLLFSDFEDSSSTKGDTDGRKQPENKTSHIAIPCGVANDEINEFSIENDIEERSRLNGISQMIEPIGKPRIRSNSRSKQDKHHGHTNGMLVGCEPKTTVNAKKKTPKKPPRKNKPGMSLSPRSDFSSEYTEASDTSFDDLDELEVSFGVRSPSDVSSISSVPRPQIRVHSRRTQQKSLFEQIIADHDMFNGQTTRTDNKRPTQEQRKQSRKGRTKSVESSQRRPESLPIFKSYEEYKTDYFDQYFYDESDTRFGRKTTDSVVNVAEILKIRSDKKKANNNHSKDTNNKAPTVKEFLMNLPSSKLDKKAVKYEKCGHNSSVKPVENFQATYTKIPQHANDGSYSENFVLQKHGTRHKSTNDLRGSNHASTDDFRQRSNSHGVAASKDKMGANENLSKTDWSFGYPRKSRSKQNINVESMDEKAQSSNFKVEEKGLKQETRSIEFKEVTPDKDNVRTISLFDDEAMFDNAKGITDVLKYLDDICDMNENSCSDDNSMFYDEDEEMERLLHHTETLLSRTDGLLNADDVEGATDQDGEAQDNDEEIENEFEHESEFEEPLSLESADKCEQFLNTQTIGINGIDRESTPDNYGNTYTKSNVGRDNTCGVNNMNDLNKNTIKAGLDKNSNIYDRSNNNTHSHNFKPKIKDKPPISDIRGITEFISQSNFEAGADDELPMRRGEILHVGLDGQDSGDWYWAFSPRLGKYGFVPKSMVKIPLVTII